MIKFIGSRNCKMGHATWGPEGEQQDRNAHLLAGLDTVETPTRQYAT